MNNGTIVVTEYDAAGEIVRKTFYYTADEAWVKNVIDARSAQSESPGVAEEGGTGGERNASGGQ